MEYAYRNMTKKTEISPVWSHTIGNIQDGKKQISLRVYDGEISKEDIVGNECFEQIKSFYGFRYLLGSVLLWDIGGDKQNNFLNMEEKFRTFLKDQSINTIVETGTWKGVSSAILAHYAKKVITIDIALYFEPLPLWLMMGVKDKIDYVVIDDDEDKKKFLETADFDFAFLDGDHSFEGVKRDFEMVKKCGRVLFHDYSDAKGAHEVKRFIDTLPKKEIRILPPFAYWEKDGYTKVSPCVGQ